MYWPALDHMAAILVSLVLQGSSRSRQHGQSHASQTLQEELTDVQASLSMCVAVCKPASPVVCLTGP